MGTRTGRRTIAAGLALVLAPFAAGCGPLGPQTVPMDRASYSDALGESWMRQTMLNIIKIRYLNPPVFVDVASVVGGYSTETEVSAGANVFWPLNMPDSASLGGKYKYTDRPTITYTPMTGTRFMRGLMTPIRPEELFFGIQSGWSAEVILTAGLATINSLRNREPGIDGMTPPDPDFVRVLQLMQKIHQTGAVALRILSDDQKRTTTLWTLHDERISGETAADGKELRRLLRLNPDAREFRLVFGNVSANDTEIAVRTRSLLQIMTLIAAEIEVPEEHVRSGRTMASIKSSLPPLIRIRSASSAPSDAMVAVEHRGYWFWIDDTDLRSKRGFTFLMLLFTMTDTGEPPTLPLVTIPAQ